MSKPAVDREFLLRTLYVLLLAAAVAAAAATLVVGYQVFLLLFASILFGVFLMGIGHFLEKLIRVPHPWNVLIVFALLLAAFVGLAVNFTVKKTSNRFLPAMKGFACRNWEWNI